MISFIAIGIQEMKIIKRKTDGYDYEQTLLS